MESIIVRDLKKYYGSVKAVNGINFTVQQGEIFGMLGPNGAGKTTTVESIIGLTKRDDGSVILMGHDPLVNQIEVKKRIGVSLQSSVMFARLTVREIIRLYGSFYPNSIGFDECISLVGLEDKTKTRTAKLSGGQLQRLSVALALINNEADILFLDEPTSGLDPQSRRQIWDVVMRMKEKGKTIFLTTHYMDEAEQLCDRVAIIDHGEIIALDAPARLIETNFREKAVEFTHPQMASERDFSKLDAVTKAQVQKDHVILYSSEISKTIAILMKWAEELGTDLEDLLVRRASLEDVFIKLTGRRIRE